MDHLDISQTDVVNYFGSLKDWGLGYCSVNLVMEKGKIVDLVSKRAFMKACPSCYTA